MTSTTRTIPAVDHFDVRLTIDYTCSEIPPRCRKPRMVAHQTEGTWQVPIVNPADAPVAFTIAPAYEGDVHGPRKIRQIAGHLYAPDYDRTGKRPIIAGSTLFPDHVKVGLYGVQDTSSEGLMNQALAHGPLASSIIINDEVWRSVGEPRYTVMTFGLGANHGGTSITVHTHDNGNIPGENYFRADEFDAALEHARDVAAHRGDTEDVNRWDSDPYRDRLITVHDPSAVKLVTPPATPRWIVDLRWDYSCAVRYLERASNPERESQEFSEVCELRKKIVDAGYCPVDTDVRPYEDR